MRQFSVVMVGALFGCAQIGSNALPLSSDVIEVETASVFTMDYRGPEVGESASTFTDYRYWLEATHKDSGEKTRAEGYFTADGDAANSGANRGSLWRANLVLEQPGSHDVTQYFCSGTNVALDGCEGDRVGSRQVTFIDGSDVALTKRRLTLTQGATRYLEQGDAPFIKTGAGSPENILAYADFDGTYDAGGTPFPALAEDQLHAFKPHLKDARPDDPAWGNGKGAALLGLFNYYEEVGVNSQYLVAMNIHGDGWDVSPWVSHDDPYVFDVSKLAQWRTVFEHANKRGVAIHFFFTETENESFLEAHDGLTIGEDFAPSRKLYYREMVARFGHLPMIIWNLGEENGVAGNSGEDPYRQPTSPAQRMVFADYIDQLDHRGHAIVSHNWPDEEEAIYGTKLGHASFSGISLQAHHNYFDKVMEWTQRSAAAGRPWMVSIDEPLGWEFGARPDADVDRRDEVLTVLWPSLLGGATGVEWYFGWQNNAPTSDLSSEDQRSRDRLWRTSAKVRTFFEGLPLTKMSSRRDGEMMILEGEGYRLAMTGETVVYKAPNKAPRTIDPFSPK